MRINVYSQELSDEVEMVTSRPIGEADPVFYAARLFLQSPPTLHADDPSAITFWLPKSPERREAMARAFEEIASIFRNAPPAEPEPESLRLFTVHDERPIGSVRTAVINGEEVRLKLVGRVLGPTHPDYKPAG